MSEEDALIVADTFKSLIRGYTIEQATAALTEDFVDYSSAVSIVINKGAAVPNDITQPIFTSRAQFIEGHGKQQPIPVSIGHEALWHDEDNMLTPSTSSKHSMSGITATGPSACDGSLPDLDKVKLQRLPPS